MTSDTNTESFTLIEGQNNNFLSQGKDDTVYFDFSHAFTEVFNQGKNELELDENKEENHSVFFKDIKPSLINLDERYFIKDNFVEIIKEKNFPFTKGEGIKHTFEKIGLTICDDTKNKISITKFKEKKFATKEMFRDENGKIKKKRKRRKFKPDNIRKKIKAKFHKDLKNIINKKLKFANSKKLFELLPQNFITNITIKLNQQAMNLTYEEIIMNNWLGDIGGREYGPDKDKYDKNLELLKYLNENKEISKKSEFNIIKNMTYEEILNAYFTSKEFENSLIEIYDKNKMEKLEYIEEYINKSFTYVDFFKNPPKRRNCYDN